MFLRLVQEGYNTPSKPVILRLRNLGPPPELSAALLGHHHSGPPRTGMESWRPSFAGLLLFFFILVRCSSSPDIVGPGRVITDGGTLVSAGGIFELGFFSPSPDTSSWYLGIWYKNITPQVVIWVANRETRLRNASGSLNLTDQGVLVLVNSSKGVKWSSNTSRAVQDPVAQLLDSGNLVVREKDDEDQANYSWQSFDYPSDTLLSGLRIGKDLQTGFETYLSAWKSTDNPAPGLFSIHMDARGYPQLVVKKGNAIQYRVGSWNGLTWTGSPYVVSGPSYIFEFEFNEKEVYYYFEVEDGSDLTWATLTSTGVMQRYLWSDQSRSWQVISTSRNDACENYALCGAYSSCTDPGSLFCSCLEGFVPKSPSELNSGNWSGGCVRRTPLGCAGDWFMKHSKVKLPDTSSSTWSNSSRSLDECKRLCSNNCNCTGYAYLDVRGTGCLFWYDELIDIRTLDEGGQDLFVRLAASERGKFDKKRPFDKQKKAVIIAGSTVFVGAIVVLMVWLRFLRRKSIRKAALVQTVGDIKDDGDVPTFDLKTIADATNNFSNNNKLGQGGFGPVYKGTLANGQDIAVKKLSKSSSQGLTEFKTEVKLIAKLQHRNLVRLLGFCFHEDGKMLIYEYMANKSLDFYVFDKSRSKMLDWTKRISIIGGIARGLLYLHQDSRLKIIHRDLKASNILLDSNMNSKISDFGLARTFGADQSQANTKKMVGTYGYMAPEYVMDGLFSTNSDVFSFGVLVLEIISGKKNRGFYHPDHDLNLLGHAWMLWTKEKPLELIDECLAKSCEPIEVIRCIHLALLCVQQRPENRPMMAAVVMMLSTENSLPEPNQPGYFMERNPPPPSDTSKTYSANDVTMTVLEAR